MSSSPPIPFQKNIIAGSGLTLTGSTMATSFDPTIVTDVSAKKASAYVLLSNTFTTGTSQPTSLPDALFIYNVAGGAVNGNGTLGVVSRSFASSGAETGTGSNQGGLGSAVSATQPYNITDFPGQNNITVQLRTVDGDDVLVSDLLSSITGADASTKVYCYLSYRSDLGADLKWRLWYYYRRSSDGYQTPFTPDLTIANASLYAPVVYPLLSLPVGAGLGGPIVDGDAAAVLGPKSVGTAELDDLAVTTAKIAAGAVTAAKLASTAVTPGSYTSTNLTVDQQGRITAAASGSAGPSLPLSVANGGTALTSYAVGDILYASGTGTLAKLADVATGQVLTSGGVGVAPAYSASPTVTTLTGSTSVLTPLVDANSAAALNIGTTNATSIALKQNTTLPTTKTLTVGSNVLVGSVADKLNASMLAIASQATGDILYADTASTFARLPKGTDGKVLTLSSGLPAWSQSPGSEAVYGDGSDGAVDLNGSNTYSFMSYSAPTYIATRDLYIDTLIVRSTNTLNMAGYRLHCKTLLTVESGGNVNNSGSIGAGFSGGNGGSTSVIGGGASGGSGSFFVGTSGSSISTNGIGGIGGAGGSGNGGVNGGGSGGSMVNPIGSAGGYRSFQAVQLGGMMVSLTFSSTPQWAAVQGGSGGGSGGGDGSNIGGSGGGGGGVLCVLAKALNLSGAGALQSNGGAGVTPTLGNAGGGGGGGGGAVFVIYGTKTGTGTITADGGAGGAGRGTGVAGSAGAAGTVITLIN